MPRSNGDHSPRRSAAGLLVLFAFLLTGTPANAGWRGESGSLFSRSFTPRAYQASPQNWAAVQDVRGIMYFGNTGGVLEYDGVSWRKIKAGSGPARSLALDDRGTVYVGSQGDFGYLEPDATGNLHYTSLAPAIPAEARRFADIWSILTSGDAVYFGSYQAIFRWSRTDRTIRVWKPAKAFGRLFLAGGTMYAVSQGQGLQRLRGEQWEPVPGGESFGQPDVRAMFIVPGTSALELATRTALYRYDGQTFRKFAPDAEAVLKDRLLNAARPLADGTLVVATARGGLAILNPDGSLARIFTKEQGLLSDALTGLYPDREGGLWITSTAGLERVELAMTRFGRAEGLNGSVYALARHDGRLYAGADTGLFSLHPGPVPQFGAVTGLNMPVFALLPTAHGMLAGSQIGLHLVSATGASVVHLTDVIYDIALSARNGETAYAAGRGGLYEVLWNGGAWKIGRKFAANGTEFRSVMEDPDGRIWITTPRAILRVDWREATEAVEAFGADRGVPDGFKNIYRLGSDVVFATSLGLLEFSPANARFVPKPGFPRKPVSNVKPAPDGALWITGDGYHGILRPGQPMEPMPLLRSDATELYAMLPEADGTVWAAGTEGFLVRYTGAAPSAFAAFGVEVRQVQSQSGVTAFAGAGSLAQVPRLVYRNNSLRFEFAAPFMTDPARVEYQVRLDGTDRDWSKWTGETHRDYTQLFEGSYRFRVRARTPQGALSAEREFPFTVLAPWYRAWWAWLTYALGALSGVWGFVRMRVRRLEEEKEQLEVIVTERTAEIRQQRDQIQMEEQRSQSLLLNILPGSVAEELKNTGTVQPQHYEEVTVCFTDFVGFTLSSEEMPSGELVSSLNEYFTTFDEIVEAFGLEKLKTIGDSYMLVSGLPRPHAGHAVDAVLAALRMVDAVAELATRGDGAVWGVRIGLHSGPVSAGVVGVRKFAFDIWGNTVNLASRMESSGAPGMVNVSARTWELVAEFFDGEARGMVQTKDKRDREMYFVLGLKPEFEQPERFREIYRERFGEEPGYGSGG